MLVVALIEMFSTAAVLSLTKIVGYVCSLFVPPDISEVG